MGTIRTKNRKEYVAWKMMKARCYAPSIQHGNYKKNNIQVCNRWLNSFENFLKDMGKCPKDFSLDRKNNNKNYTPNNCRWASKKTQSNNRGSFNKLFTYEGKTKVLKDWAVSLGIKYTTLYNRIYRSNLSFEEAITKDPFKKLITYKGKSQTMKEWSEELNLPYNVLIDRKFQGWDINSIFEKPIKIKI